MDIIIQCDIWLFKAIHLGLANDFFDHLMPLLRNKYTWIPLYLIFIVYSIRKYKKQSWIVILAAILLVLTADQFSAGLVKEWVQRLRPCNDPGLSSIIRPLVHCGNGFSFISSHATNHFALAVLFTWFFTGINKWTGFKAIFYIWAFSIALAQVYVGVHYPFDVIVGAIAGIIIGLLFVFLIKKGLKALS